MQMMTWVSRIRGACCFIKKKIVRHGRNLFSFIIISPQGDNGTKTQSVTNSERE